MFDDHNNFRKTVKFESLNANLSEHLLMLVDKGDTITARFITPFRDEEPWPKTSWSLVRRAIRDLCVEYFK